MTKNKKRKDAARTRKAVTGESYTRAAMQIARNAEYTSRWTPTQQDEVRWNPDAHGPLLISGRPSSGKTTLMHRLWEEHEIAGGLVAVVDTGDPHATNMLRDVVQERFEDPDKGHRPMILVLKGDITLPDLEADDPVRVAFHRAVLTLMRCGRSFRTYLLAESALPGMLNADMINSIGHVALSPGSGDANERWVLGISDQDAAHWNNERTALVSWLYGH